MDLKKDQKYVMMGTKMIMKAEMKIEMELLEDGSESIVHLLILFDTLIQQMELEL